jgi:transcriptional regulator with XRE-family HTH domain
MELYESIRKARQQAGVSGAKIAELLGMSAQAYRRYERGEVVPNATTILELAEILQCSPTALMQTGGVEEQRPTNLQQFDFELREGETLSIAINATVSPTTTEATIKPAEPYRPKRGLATPVNSKAKNSKF